MDALEVTVSATVYARALELSHSEPNARMAAAAAVDGWRTRDETDTRPALTFAQDWPL
ncbi:hypothetical protein [Candidatus Poriferisodalis sp.]|uniref:hypothetical protein n=1 Tax=Candidatus Poriferisodalis sp. TaxID=3101277 RepID=UPI003B5B5857